MVSLYSRVEHPLPRQMVSLEGVLGRESLPFPPFAPVSLPPPASPPLAAFPLLSHCPRPLPDPESSALLCWAVPGCTLSLGRASSSHTHVPGLAWWSSGEDSMRPLQGALELRSHMPQSLTKKKNRKKISTPPPTSSLIVPRHRKGRQAF